MTGKRHVSMMRVVGTIVCTGARQRENYGRSINGRPMCVWRCLARACRVVGYLQTNEMLDTAPAERARNFCKNDSLSNGGALSSVTPRGHEQMRSAAKNLIKITIRPTVTQKRKRPEHLA